MTEPAYRTSSSPSAGATLVGLAGIGARAGASVAIGMTALGRAATRPTAAAIRAGLRTPPGIAVRAEAEAFVHALDAAGRKDIARARAEVDRALDAAVDRLTTDAISSQRTSLAIERLLESEDLWRIVDRIAKSPEVLNAIASASAGLTGVVADEARRHTVSADEFAERIARRVLRRPPREPVALLSDPAPSEGAAPGS